MPDYERKFRLPLINLNKEYESLKDITLNAIHKVMQRGDFILGKDVAQFEEEFAAYCGTKYCITMGSGTASLLACLLSYGIGAGHEVIIPAFTFKATALAVKLSGALPVPVDVDPITGNIDPAKIESLINESTKAIMPVHLFGCPCPMDSIMEIASKYDLRVIEDACEAHGALYKNQKTGSIGHCGVFSFYPSKNLGGYGNGGCITTNDEKLNKSARSIREYGNGNNYGFNSRLDTIQAAVLLEKLKFLDDWNQKRQFTAKKYGEYLQGLPVELPYEDENFAHVYYLYVIKAPKRDELDEYLNRRGVESRIHFSPPIHLHEDFKYLNAVRGDYPIAEDLASRVLSLPMGPFMSQEEVEYISDLIKAFYRKF